MRSIWIVVVAHLIAVPIYALTLPAEREVHHEDFVGEVAFPTSPETDVFGLGGATGFEFPAGSGWQPTLVGGVARAAVGPHNTDGRSGVALASTTDVPGALGLRVRFDALVVNVDEITLVTATVGRPHPTIPGSLFYYNAAVEFTPTSPGVLGARFLLQEADDVIVTVLDSASLSAAQQAALVAGTPFEIDLIARPHPFDDLEASLAIDGQPLLSIAPVSRSIDAAPGFTEVGAVLINQFANGGPQTLGAQVDILSLQRFDLVTTRFTVDTSLDLEDPNSGDLECGGSPNTCSLRAAIMESNEIVGFGEITLPAGTYDFGITGVDEDEAKTGDLDILERVEISGGGRSTTFVSGEEIDRVFQIVANPLGPIVALRDLTIENGLAGTEASPTGGGIENAGILALEGCRVRSNHANLAGGIMNRGTLAMDDCIVESNEALPLGFISPDVGGIASASTLTGGTNVSATIRDSAIVSNSGATTGGLELGDAAQSRVENSTISGNIGVQIHVASTSADLVHNTIVGGVFPALSALSVGGSGKLTLANNAISGSPACAISVPSPPIVVRLGNNAGADTSCGFTGAGDVQGVPLDLAALGPVGASQAHAPNPTSPLIDAADATECLARDQIGTTRPQDGDGVGSIDCDLGSIERLPEPGVALGVFAGACCLQALATRRPRRRAAGGVADRLR